MESRERFRAAGKDELRDLADVEGVDRVLEPRDVDGRDPGDLRPFGRPRNRELCTHREVVVLDLRQQFLNLPSGLHATSGGGISTSTLPGIQRRKPSSEIRATIRSLEAG